MRLLVTSGVDFIGSAAVRQSTLQRGHEVVHVDALTYVANLSNLSCVADDPRCSFVQADVADEAELEKVFMEHEPDAVMHLAAESHVDRSTVLANLFEPISMALTHCCRPRRFG